MEGQTSRPQFDSIIISVFTGSFSVNNLLTTIPVWGPEYQMSFEFSVTSDTEWDVSTLIVFTSTGRAEGSESGTRVPATFIKGRLYLIFSGKSLN